MTDKEILAVIRTNGRHQNLKTLYNSFPLVRKFVISNSGKREDAEDIFQEALVIFTKKARRKNFELRVSIDAFIFQCARNLWLRRIEKQGLNLMEHFDAVDAGEDIDTDTELRYECAESALERITAACKRILTMSFVDDLSIAEITARLKLSSETATRTRKYKCLERAKEIYRELIKKANI